MDVLVIGAGQAGLAMGYYLRQTSLSFQLVERYPRVGDSWRKRYDTLLLFTPRNYSALPGLALPGDPEGYAGRDEFAGYLETYACHFELPVSLGVGVQSLERQNGGFRALTSQGMSIQARAVVLATGAFQQPAIPSMAKQLSPQVAQLSPENYKNSAQVPRGTVLVVGDGATGRDIARDLSNTHSVILSVGKPRKLVPERVLGKSTWWWLDKLGVLSVPGESAVGRRLRRADPFPGRGKSLKLLQSQGVKLAPRVVEAQGVHVKFANGETAEIDAVVWATGYRDDTGWVAIPEVKDERGNFIQRHGISPIANLYFIGRSWQRSRGSATITGVGRDARALTETLLTSMV